MEKRLEAALTEPILLFGIPIDFVLFALTLLGIALFHRHTLPIALAGLAVITAYKLIFTGFRDGAGFAGLGLHLTHEFSLLANLFLLLMGFALLSRHFEESAIPDEMPAAAAGRLEGRRGVACHCVRAVELSGQYRRCDHRWYGRAPGVSRQGPHRLSCCNRCCIKCRRFRQRRRRHDNDHDVGFRGKSVVCARSLHRGDCCVCDLRRARFHATTPLLAHRQARTAGALLSTGHEFLSLPRC